jgi:aconitase B
MVGADFDQGSFSTDKLSTRSASFSKQDIEFHAHHKVKCECNLLNVLIRNTIRL